MATTDDKVLKASDGWVSLNALFAFTVGDAFFFQCKGPGILIKEAVSIPALNTYSGTEVHRGETYEILINSVTTWARIVSMPQTGLSAYT